MFEPNAELFPCLLACLQKVSCDAGPYGALAMQGILIALLVVLTSVVQHATSQVHVSSQ